MAPGRKILLPLTNPRIEVMGTSETPLPKLIEEAVQMVREMCVKEGGGDV